MRQELFNSRKLADIAEEIWINWDEDEYGPRPKSYDNESIWNMAWDYIADDYHCLKNELCQNGPDKILLAGYLGLWNCQPFAHKVTTPEHAFDCPYDDVAITYEDGDIWVSQYHHDGINDLRVLGLKSIYDFNDSGLSDEEYEDLYEFLYALEDGCPMTKELMDKYLPMVSFSVAPCFKDWLTKEAVEDMEKHCELVGG